ncbi:MAG TPA: hypothetical protein VG917_03420 [Patescibacteria group bacterium]|nr:hypothetical protein [Patescibacteria group bacterium]
MDVRGEFQSPEKPQIVTPKLVLLLGPSGVGKTEIIKRLTQLDNRIVASPVYTDRPARADDVGRVSVSPEVFEQMEKDGEFLHRKDIYGSRYAMSKKTIMEALSNGQVPIQDFPIEDIPALKDKAPIYTIYILPPSLTELKRRLGMDNRDIDGSRYEESKAELLKYVKQHFKSDNIDDVVINKDVIQATQQVLNSIYSKVTK